MPIKFITSLWAILLAFSLLSFTDLGTEEGMASYYHDDFNGKKTSSGERFDNTKLIAAHKKYPFGTLIKVTNTSNQQSVVVRVADRGPHSKKRVIDLSKAAFNSIASISKGVIKVKVELYKGDTLAKPKPEL
jgi:rare lipoprotein A